MKSQDTARMFVSERGFKNRVKHESACIYLFVRSRQQWKGTQIFTVVSLVVLLFIQLLSLSDVLNGDKGNLVSVSLTSTRLKSH